MEWMGVAGFSVYFRLGGARYRLGIYKYVEAPPGEHDSLQTAWLEAYADGSQEPIVFLPFNPSTLAPTALEALRTEFSEEWARRRVAGVREE